MAEFLADPEVELVGYQVHPDPGDLGLLLFNHSCGTTFSVFPNHLLDLYDGPLFADERPAPIGSPPCPGFCLRKSDTTSQCPVECECAAVRSIMAAIHRREAER